MTTAELEAKCRAIIADMVERGRRGELDPVLHTAILDGLRRREGAKSPQAQITAAAAELAGITPAEAERMVEGRSE